MPNSSRRIEVIRWRRELCHRCDQMYITNLDCSNGQDELYGLDSPNDSTEIQDVPEDSPFRFVVNENEKIHLKFLAVFLPILKK
ncbi:hypothetical protein L596_025427 [Steinernema carpocapsae]|uniref:Uncharacterized protein n=1 Tax=Steinernema carpocapsae TaxID=34508 RepID=A0A4U5M7R6_STECR|nr:hypothetical protein L596_025427 [Steinernema carpocapsae]